ncbi:MAG: hypothetical protein AAF380_01555, partial [Bacteroidota bacterium]
QANGGTEKSKQAIWDFLAADQNGAPVQIDAVCLVFRSEETLRAEGGEVKCLINKIKALLYEDSDSTTSPPDTIANQTFLVFTYADNKIPASFSSIGSNFPHKVYKCNKKNEDRSFTAVNNSYLMLELEDGNDAEFLPGFFNNTVKRVKLLFDEIINNAKNNTIQPFTIPIKAAQSTSNNSPGVSASGSTKTKVDGAVASDAKWPMDNPTDTNADSSSQNLPKVEGESDHCSPSSSDEANYYFFKYEKTTAVVTLSCIALVTYRLWPEKKKATKRKK